MKRRNGFTDDIRWSKIYCLIAVYFVLFLVIAAVTFFATFLITLGESKQVQSHNAEVEEFNALPQTERTAVAKWNEYEVDENYLRALEPMPQTLAEIFFGGLPYVVVFCLCFISIGALDGYHQQKSKEYFYADYPFSGIHSWIIFFWMWFCWLILLVSFIRMKCWEAKQKAGQKITDQQTNQEPKVNGSQNGTATEDAASGEETEEDEYVTYEDLSVDRTCFDEDSCEQFIKYCQNESQYKREQRVNNATKEVQKIEDNLRKYGQDIQKLQAKLKNAKLNLEKAKNSGPREPKNPEALKADWEAIKNMRGVIDIYYAEITGKLCIRVNARVPYAGKIYDFGDYDIEICHDVIECSRVRSGVRDDWHGGCPDYCYCNNDAFCFGNREDSIKDYISEQRFREAIILAIDCLHSVNDADEATNIPNCFRRVVPPKEG